MCGIAGIISTKGFDPHILCDMSQALQHRGPDGRGYSIYTREAGMRTWYNQDIPVKVDHLAVVGLGHLRLAIIDLSPDGLQPMTEETGELTIVFNGEIYNYLELREELEKQGFHFTTNSDTEVLLQAYRAWGMECLQRFNGMWAFALLDLRKRTLLLSRDRFGIKPLYYAIHNGFFVFASEIKALLTVPFVPCIPNEKIVGHYLLTGLVDHTAETFFEGIYQFPSAHWAEVSLDAPSLQLEPQRYWNLPQEINHLDERQIINEFRSLFLDALRLHARSDVPVGTCLSGGLDSSSIVCGSEILRKDQLIPQYSHMAYGYCASEEAFSERIYMQSVIDATAAKMNFIEISSDDFLKVLTRIIREQDEPFGSASIVAQWFVFQRARQTGMTVMLDGQGADEIMGGYHYYFQTIARSFALRGNFSGILSLREQYRREFGEFPFSFDPVSLLYLVSPSPVYNLARSIRARFIAQKSFLYAKNFESTVLKKDFMQAQVRDLPYFGPYHSLDEHLRADMQFLSLPALLRYEDRNSMAHSIEARVPFLDYRLVEFLFKVPEYMKVRGVTTKYVLRRALKDVLPRQVLDRKDKIGFKSASHLTFDFIDKDDRNLIENRTEFEQRWFDTKGLESVLSYSPKEASIEFNLWRVLNIKLWARNFWDA